MDSATSNSSVVLSTTRWMSLPISMPSLHHPPRFSSKSSFPATAVRSLSPRNTNSMSLMVRLVPSRPSTTRVPIVPVMPNSIPTLNGWTSTVASNPVLRNNPTVFVTILILMLVHRMWDPSRDWISAVTHCRIFPNVCGWIWYPSPQHSVKRLVSTCALICSSVVMLPTSKSTAPTTTVDCVIAGPRRTQPDVSTAASWDNSGTMPPTEILATQRTADKRNSNQPSCNPGIPYHPMKCATRPNPFHHHHPSSNLVIHKQKTKRKKERRRQDQYDPKQKLSSYHSPMWYEETH
mmetsp:Transcript_25374/g.43191  ORF Transcript_25374/g.43191 Transcript_25374/m.43191 type:complete len:292 (+) Transcript_25374:385-1260(+)